MAKRIIEAHKGTISLASTVGKGTTVTIRLPITQAVAVTA
jgi:signal transduction histidine kinase